MSGSVTGTDMRPNSEQTYNDSVSKVEETLARFEQEVEGVPAPPAPADNSKSTPESEPKDEPDSNEELDSNLEPEPADNDEPTPEPKKGDSGEPEKPEESEKPTIPDNYYRAALHAGWKPERISKLYEADSEGTVEFLKKIYEDTNNLSGQFAELGRAKKTLEQKQAEQITQKETKPELNLEKFKECYEDDPAGAIFELMRTQQKPAEQSPAQPVQNNQRNEDVQIAQQLHTFFTGKDLKAYKDFYGSPAESNPYDWSVCTPGQNTNRQAVIQEADAIIAGYALQGKQISITDALEKAHLRISAPIAEKVVREELVSQVKKRSKGITLRPSNSQSVVASSKAEEKSEAKAINTAAKGLKELREKGF